MPLTRRSGTFTSLPGGFETPTINELSYRPDGQSGLNFALQPATNTTVEAGGKWQVGTGMASLERLSIRTRKMKLSLPPATIMAVRPIRTQARRAAAGRTGMGSAICARLARQTGVDAAGCDLP